MNWSLREKEKERKKEEKQKKERENHSIEIFFEDAKLDNLKKRMQMK